MHSKSSTISILLTATIVAVAITVHTEAWMSPFAVLKTRTTFPLYAVSQSTTAKSSKTSYDFIDNGLRAAAMSLHTREQAPKEGQAKSIPREPYTPTRDDYLAFLVDSLHIYEAFEDIVNTRDELKVFRNTGMERTGPLKKDIEFMVNEYNLKEPNVGKAGQIYAQHLRQIKSIPEFMCHFYNHYFAHTAGGRMIGKQMSALLLDKKTLEFYKWDGDLNEIKSRVKQSIEDMAAAWSPEERQECIDATADAFSYAGLPMSYLSGNKIE